MRGRKDPDPRERIGFYYYGPSVQRTRAIPRRKDRLQAERQPKVRRGKDWQPPDSVTLYVTWAVKIG